MKKLICVWILTFTICFMLIYSFSSAIISQKSKEQEEQRRSICLEEVLKHDLYADENAWGYEITEVFGIDHDEKEYLIKIYREIHNDSEYWGAIDYWIGGYFNGYVDMDWFYTEYFTETDYD